MTLNLVSFLPTDFVSQRFVKTLKKETSLFKILREWLLWIMQILNAELKKVNLKYKILFKKVRKIVSKLFYWMWLYSPLIFVHHYSNIYFVSCGTCKGDSFKCNHLFIN